MRTKRICTFIYPAFFIGAILGLFGCFNFHVHNPGKPGSYPKFSKEIILLAELTPVRQHFDVSFYDLDIAIEPDAKSLSGWVEVRAVAVEDIDSIQLDLDQALSIEDIHWESRMGDVLNYTRHYRAIYLQLPKKILKGQPFSLHIQYSGKPVIARKPPWVGGLVWEKDKQGNPWAGVACESEGASIWFPCKDHTSDEPDSVRMHFTISDTSLFVVSNGQFCGAENHAGAKTFNWKVTYPINVYNMTFYLGNYELVKDSIIGIFGKKLMLNHYMLKPNVDIARVHFQQVKDQLQVYEELYGEYPWYNDGFKLVESPYEGMEHQTAIAYGNGYKNDIDGKVDYIILHESGHEWFGNAVTVADFADIWIQEGFATYGEYLYLESIGEKKQAEWEMLIYKMMIKNKRPLVGPVGRRYFSYRDSDVYFKGAWVLNSLRGTINNDSLFFTIIRTFYEENKYGLCDSKSFMETTNRITGKDYGWFFQQYLYDNRVPILEWEYAWDGAIYYRWTDVREDFNKLPVAVKFERDPEKYIIFPSVHLQRFVPSVHTSQAPSVRILTERILFGTKRKKQVYQLYLKEH